MKQYKNRKWLNQKYSTEKLNTYQIAELCNCGHETIRRWLIKLNIQIRSKSNANHLARGNHCNLSNEALYWINGELLGDGCLISRSKYSAQFHYSSKYKEYINYVSDTLKSFGIKQSGKTRKFYHKKRNYYTYHYESCDYPELLPIYKQWYPKGKKIIPRDLKLTSLVLRQEYIGDGCLHHISTGKPYIVLSTTGFSIIDVEWLKKELNKLGFKATRQPSHNKIRISSYSTEDFLNYIGKPSVKCYKYKWDY